MRRLRFLTALVAVLALAVTSAALAASSVKKVTGGTTTLALNSAATAALTASKLTVTPVAPATASGSTFTFPIAAGRINTKNYRGFITHRGGFTVSNGTKSGTVRYLTIVSDRKGVNLYGATRRSAKTHCHVAGRPGHRHAVCKTVVHWRAIKLAKITGAKVTGTTATGQAHLSAEAAKLLNGLAGGSTFKAGQVFGTVTVSPTLA